MLMLALVMEKPARGTVEIEYDGGSTRVIPAADLAPGTFAYAPQGNMLMNGTVRDAITLPTSQPPSIRQTTTPAKSPKRVSTTHLENQLTKALGRSSPHRLQAPPYGVDTSLGEKGSGLFEGRMQRLACARAVYSGSPVLLLDERTSALDSATERENLDRLRALGRTVIIVTHRPAALEVCDRVIKIEG